MAISFYCQCGQSIKAPDPFAGRKTKCPKCSNVLTVPATSQTEPPPAPDGPRPPGPAGMFDADAPRQGGTMYDAGDMPGRMPEPRPRVEERRFPVGLIMIVLALAVVAAGYLLFFPKKGFPWEPYSRKPRTAQGEPWGPTLNWNRGDRLTLTGRDEVTMTAQVQGTPKKVNATVTTTCSMKVLDVLRDGNRRMRADFDYEAEVQGATAIPSFTMEFVMKEDGSPVPDSVVLKGLDASRAAMIDAKSMGNFGIPPPLRIGEAADINRVVSAEQLKQGILGLALGAIRQKSELQGEIVLEGFQERGGSMCAKYSFDGELRIEGAGDGKGELLAGIRLKGELFLDKEKGYPKGGEFKYDAVAESTAAEVSARITVKESISGEFQAMQ